MLKHFSRVRGFPQLFKNFSKTLVYVYRYAFKSFSKVSFSEVFSKSKVYVYLSEQMFEKSNKISDGLFYYISNAHIF